MDSRGRALPGGAATSPESAMASQLFDQFVSAGTFKSVLYTYRQLCEVLRLKPTNITNFYPRLKAKLHSWRAASLWAKLDKRASHKCYNRGKACPNTRVLLIGAGPCGLRAAIEAQLLGAKVVVVEKRDRFSRNNVLHLWPFVIHDLRNLGGKKFFGKFCAGSIDHISIRQLQIILLKVALLLGVEVHENVGFESLIEPQDDQTNERIGWHAHVSPADHPVSLYEFDVLIGADGKRNTLLGFNRKEFRGKLAIAVTANFINRHTIEEARVPEISGVAFIFNQKFFQDMRDETGIDLENIVYYKDDTHYFVMTAKKQSLLERGVIINDYNDTARLLAAENVDREALMEYARDAADFATDSQFPHFDFAVNHYGQADVAMFDFTSMYAAENACRVVEKNGHKLLQGLVGDSLLEPFWPTGSGCARGFLSSFDVAWMIRSWASGRLTTLQVLAEREAIYRLLAQTTPENLSKDINQYTLNPSSRYPNLNLQAVLPSQVRSLYVSDSKIEEHILDVAVEHPKRKRHRESLIYPDALLNWCQRQVALSEKTKIHDFTTSWKSGLALCTILHRYRPDLIDINSLDPENIAKNNQLAFDVCERELGIPPVMTGQEMADCTVPDKLSMVSYISQVYESFRGEIPVVCLPKSTSGEDRAISPNKQLHSTPLSILTKISSRLQSKRKYSVEKEISKDRERGENVRRKSSALTHKRRSREKGIALDLINKDITLTNYKSLPMNKPRESINTRVKNLEEQMKKDAGLRCHLSEESESTKAARIRSEQAEMNIKMLQEQLQKNGTDSAVKKARVPKVGKLRKDEWNVKIIEEKTKQQNSCQKQTNVEKPKIFKELFENKLHYVDEKLKAGGGLTESERAKYQKFDASFNKLNQRLTKGNLDSGDRGHNQTSLMTEHMTTIWDRKANRKKDPLPPAPMGNVKMQPDSAINFSGSESCYFCQKRVYSMEQLSAEGLFFHRSCFKCEYCSTSLRLGNYSFDRDAACGGKFYCHSHYRMQKPDQRSLEIMKKKQAFLTGGFEEEKEKLYKTLLDNTEKALSPGTKMDPNAEKSTTDSPTPANKSFNIDRGQAMSPSNMLLEPLNIIGRDQTPERVEYENSILELLEEEMLTSELEEEELTQTNLGPSQDLATSEDEYSDLSTDSASDEEAYAEELERSLTADETRKLAETWQRKYSTEHSLLSISTSSSADDEGSDTEICSDDTSDDVDSDAEYNIEHSEEDGIPLVNESTSEDASKVPEEKGEFTMEVPVIDLKNISKASEEDTTSTESESSDEEEDSRSETGTEVDSDLESEPEVPLPPPQIPTIIIHEWVDESASPRPKEDVNAEEEIQLDGPSRSDKLIESQEIASTSSSTTKSEEKLENITETTKLTSDETKLTDIGKLSEGHDKDKDFDESSFTPDDLERPLKEMNGQSVPFVPLYDSTSSDTSISSGISSLAKDIVSDVLKSAKKSIAAECKPDMSKPHSRIVKQYTTSESTPHTEDSSTSSANYKVLKSSDSSSIPLIDLCSPDAQSHVTKNIPEDSVPVIDLCSPTRQEVVKMGNGSVHSFSPEKNSDLLLKKHNDVSSSPIVIDSPSLNTSNFSFDNGHECNVNVSPMKDTNHSMNHSIISLDRVDTSNGDFKTPTENFADDSSFVTIRKSRNYKDKRKFSWDSDEEAKTLDHEESILLIDENNKSDLKDGVYHATVARAIETGSTIQKDRNTRIDSVKSDMPSVQILDPKSKVTAEVNINNRPSATVPTLANKISSVAVSKLQNPSIDTISAAKTSVSVPKSPQSLIKSLGYKSYFEKSQEAQQKEVPEDIVRKDKVINNSAVSDSTYSKNSLSDGKASTLLNDSQNLSSAVKKDASEEKSPRSDSKYSGYSGSFAEKVRPKSLLCDSIYLRSLDINLQKQPFTSLSKTDEPNELSNKESLYNVKKKLFQDEDNNLSSFSKALVSKDFNAGLSKISPTTPKDLKIGSVHETHPKLKNTNILDESADKLEDNLSKPKSVAFKQSSVSFSAPESYNDLVSPYTYAQARSAVENSFPTKMRAKCDMDLTKLRHKREKRKSVHEDLQGLPFADEEKLMSPIEPPAPPDVFYTPKPPSTGKLFSEQDNWKTPDMIDEERYLRLQTTAEQEKARQEARARARLKSDEELGLSPNNYRKKYHRQLSLNSINYDELYSDEFCDQEEELEDDIISGFCQSKSSSLADTFNVLRKKEIDSKSKVTDTSEIASQISNPVDDVFQSTFITDSAAYSCKPKTRTFSESCSGNETEFNLGAVRHNKSDETLLSLKHSTKMSSSETSPDILGSETPPFDSKHKRNSKGLQRAESVGAGEDEKSKSNGGKKSIFSLLHFGKNVSKERSKQKPKEAEKELSSSLPNELGLRSISKSKPFSHLKLPKSKEKVKEKPKTKTVPPENTQTSTSVEAIPIPDDPQTVSFNVQAQIAPKYTVYRNPETMLPTFPVHLPVHKLENGLAPKASEDSFSDEDDTHGGKASGQHGDKADKKAQRMVYKVQRQQVLKRLRNAQEIQRRLEELEVEQKEMERNGVEIEKMLRGERNSNTNAKGEAELMQEWCTHIHSKNKLRREEQELLIRLKDLELEDRQSYLQQEIKKRMAQSDLQKEPSQLVEERNMLAEMLNIASKRDELFAMQEQLRLKEDEEDKNLNPEVFAKEIKSLLSPPSDKS